MSTKYTKEELIRFNLYNLRQIPDGEHTDRYAVLRKFISNERSANLSSVVKQPMIPTYLKNRYSNVGSQPFTRGVHVQEHEVTRRKIYTQKTESIADRINEEIREILSKISEGNKDKLFAEFMSKNIPDECGQTLINNIYEFSVDLSYLIHHYVEIIIKLKVKNQHLYHQLLERIGVTATEPLTSDSDANIKRLRMGNILLISEMYCKKCEGISEAQVIHILNFLVDQTLSSYGSNYQLDYLQMLCELIKKTHTRLNPIVLSVIIQQLFTISSDRKYDKKYRFMVQDVIDLCNEDDDL